MPTIRSADEIIQNMLELLRVLQPDLDTKQGTVARDLFVELPASQLSLVYDEISNAANLQSLTVVTGVDLDNLLSNYGMTRRTSSKSSGVALFTFSSLPAPVAINKGDLVTSSNGTSFAVSNGVSVNPVNSNLYRSIATKYRNDLDFLNITDPFAIEVTVQSTTPGTTGNISKYGLVKFTTPSVSNITNVFAFTGGTNQEDDPSFRNRGLAIFSGSSTGTSLGYKNAALTDSSVLDALVIGPGNPLMVRDGTISIKNTDGTYTIISEGTGGKVDVIILGNRLAEYTDSFIYQDKSNNNDPTDPKNIFVLGQITGDENKTVNRRRIDEIANATLPAQPVQEFLEVTGSLSGSNFVEKSIDIFGRVTGNYELVKDTGAYSGSPFGFDKFRWVSNKISLFEEDRIKSKSNGQDNVTFSDVIQIPKVQQNFPILNENSTVSPGDKSIIKLLHTPASNVTRVFNVNTGERYTIVDQNFDSDGTVNTTGRIQITGNTLPSTSDVLQVDYNWIVDFDPFIDYDGKIINSNLRESNDSIDWGLSNAISNERTQFNKNTDGSFYMANLKHPVSSVLSAKQFKQANGVVTLVTTGNFAGRLSVAINELLEEVSSIDNITLQNSTLEVYNTIDSDGVFSSERLVIGSEIKFNCTVILPTDTPASENDSITVYFDETDVFTVGTSVGNFTANQLTIPSTNMSSSGNSVVLRVNYLANIQDALTTSVTNLPISRVGNSFTNNSSSGFTNNFVSNIIRRENQVVNLNGSNQPFITLSINSSDFILTNDKIITIVSLKDGKEFWNADNIGTLSTDINNLYTITLNGLNSPQVGDNVVIFYTADDIKRSQPVTFNNTLIFKSIQRLEFDSINNDFFVNIQDLNSEAGIAFSIINPSTNLIVASGTGNIDASVTPATLSGGVLMFGALDELLLKKVKIVSSINPNNNGIYEISSVDSNTNKITFGYQLQHINSNQVSMVRLLDNKEIWDDSCTIDLQDNRFVIPDLSRANVNDLVVSFVMISDNLRQGPSRLAITASDQINNSGIISVAGTTVSKVNEFVITATSDGLKQNVIEAIKSALSVNSVSSIPGTISLCRITKIEKVTTTTGGVILSTDFTYDVLGTAIKNNVFYANEMIDDDSLSNLEFILPSTTNNLSSQPKLGDKLKITCYYTTINDSESLSFTRNGILYTNKLFAFEDKIFISSGFQSSSARFIISYINQPASGSRYKAFYDYIAPKQNERIVLRFNYNQLISDTTINIENNRPINADVLIKAARQMLIDLTLNVVIKPDFLLSQDTVLQNLKDKLVNAINTNKLGDIIDSSDLITVAQSVDGIDRARVIYFNESGEQGQVLSLFADQDQYFVANNVIVSQESR